MNEYNFLFPYLDESGYTVLQYQAKPNKDLPILNSEIAELQDVLFPIDPVTGLPDNPVSKLLNGNLSPLERDHILSQMQPIPASKRNNLSDEDLINMLPSRYNSTLVDMDALRDWYKTNVFDVIDAEKAEQQRQQQQQQQQQQTSSSGGE